MNNSAKPEVSIPSGYKPARNHPFRRRATAAASKVGKEWPELRQSAVATIIPPMLEAAGIVLAEVQEPSQPEEATRRVKVPSE